MSKNSASVPRSVAAKDSLMKKILHCLPFFALALGVAACDSDSDGLRDKYDCYPNNSAIAVDSRNFDCDKLFANGDDKDETGDTATTEPCELLNYYRDADGDGFGAGRVAKACEGELSDQFVLLGGDCNDSEREDYPNASELCDGRDNDCDGNTDEGVTVVVYYDGDDDGFGDSADSQRICSGDSELHYVLTAGDCDDEDDQSYPGATEVCDYADNDCNGTVDDQLQSRFAPDSDGDGYGTTDSNLWVYACSVSDVPGYVSRKTDCDDASFAINPGATEICNRIDDDCDSLVDDVDPGRVATVLWYVDSDSDGYGDVNAVGVLACDKSGDGYVAGVNTDCDDSNNRVYPTAPERCSQALVDNDCDGVADEGLDCDGDGDPILMNGNGDCDDDDPNNFPHNTENCIDFQDNDCDTLIDLADVADCFRYSDDDSDGYTEVAGDCNDADASVNPGAIEDCTNGVDDDCSGLVDDGFVDVDNDGHLALVCVIRGGNDCNDADAAVNPSAVEDCTNGIDNDCSLIIDDGVLDVDGDGFVDVACTLASGDDCDDSDPTVNPGATEDCTNGVDDNCSGSIDDARLDLDADTYVDAACSGGDDCNDLDPAVNPAAIEDCSNGVDDNCSGTVDDGFVDVDGDGHLALACAAQGGDDCNDMDSSVSPSAAEDCVNGIDNDCNGLVDDGALDRDTDGYIDLACTLASGDDCNDNNPAINPGAAEDCTNGVDDNCSGTVDDAALDQDADTYIDAACVPAGGDDCNDLNPLVNPGAAENGEIACSDTLDNDCDGSVDSDDADCAITSDYDGDGWTEAQGDCDDNDPLVNPAAEENCADARDLDCSGSGTDGSTDVDLDTYIDALCVDAGGDDCNDSNTLVNPGATENDFRTCSDTIDNDCNTLIDIDEAACAVDNDADGFMLADADCDDTDDLTFPGAAVNDSATDCTTDADLDGFGDDNPVNPDVIPGTDCNDATNLTNPSATEACADGADNDCNGLVDDAVCIGTIDCLDTGAALEVTINGSVTTGLMSVLAGPLTDVCITTWDTSNQTCTPFVGDDLDHLLTVSQYDFTPEATDGAAFEWFNLMEWDATGDCQVADDHNGNYVVSYQAP